jgi:CRISPR-associated protein Cas6/Cse3/CasE subtype I-E
MYLSQLLIDVGDNPDRVRPGRLWIRNPYRIHQRLCMAFPSKNRKLKDEDFLLPFVEDDFFKQPVHTGRTEDTGFLFRVDTARRVILVQSAFKPDWEYAFQNAEHLLAAPVQMKPYDPQLRENQFCRFRLFANPIVSISKEKNKRGNRVPLKADQLGEWLNRKAKESGFEVSSSDQLEITAGWIRIWKGKEKEEKTIKMRSALFDGLLQVNDPVKLRNALIAGIGPGKGYGFGLLSVLPIGKP